LQFHPGEVRAQHASFSATIPLTTLQPDSQGETGVFDALKDLPPVLRSRF